MKQLRYRLLIMLAALMLLPTGVGAAEAQKDLKIQDVFTRYGKKRNVTMVELSNEMLETYGMTRYKSITIKDDPEALRFTRQCLEADQRGELDSEHVMLAILKNQAGFVTKLFKSMDIDYDTFKELL